MKKITLLFALMLSSLAFAQPTTSAPVPTKLAADVVSIYGGSYPSIATDFNPNWGQTGTVNTTFDPGDGNLCMAYTNFNYQGTLLTTTNASAMEYLHVDIWTSTATNVKVSPINNGTGIGEILVDVTLVQGGWSSVDIPKSSFAGMTWNSVFQIKFDGQAGVKPSNIYLDNIYFWKAPAPAGTPVIGPLTVPAKKVGDAPFNLVDPTSDSPGAFSYTSSDLAVATISGNTVTVVGAGTSTITAIQAASGAFLTGSVTASLVVEALPATAAPTPPNRNPSDVISLYSDAYADVASNFDAGWCGGSSVQEVTIAGNPTMAFKGNNCQGIVLDSGIDASSFTNLHVDVYIAAGTVLTSSVFNLKFVQQPGGAALEINLNVASTPALVAGSWLQIDVPVNLATFTGFKEFGITSNLNNKVWYDNLYAYKGTPLGTAKFETSNVKMYPNPVKNTLTIDANASINKVSVYNILGQEVLKASPKSNSVTLQTNELGKGVYMVATEIDGKVSTSKIVKE
jgi:hypothetical protein